MSRIAAIVLNSVNHDARVLKEAESLVAAGHEVAIFGVRDNRCSDSVTIRESGLRIYRCDPKPSCHDLIGRCMLVGSLAIVALGAALTFLWFDELHAALSSPTGVGWLVWIVAGLASFLCFTAFLNQRRQARILRVAALSSSDSSQSLRVARPKGGLWAKLRHRLWRHALERELLTSIELFQPDVLHCHDLSTVPVGWKYKRKHGKPIVFDSHELYEEQSMATPMQKRVYRARQAHYSDRVEAFITINDSIATHLRERYPKLPAPVIIKNATILPANLVKDDGRLHHAAKLNPADRILLFQGGYAPFRGLDVLVRAGAVLPEPWRLVMMGWGKSEEELRAIARHLDPKGRKIRFIPGAPHAELAQWTAGASLGVIPYENVCLNHWYCTPNKLWEYPVAGVPILASPFPELQKTIEGNRIGLLLSDPVTAEDIVQKVSSLSDEQLQQMKRNCQRYIERDNWSAYESRLIELYDQLLGAKARPIRPAGRRPRITEPKLVPAAVASDQ